MPSSFLAEMAMVRNPLCGFASTGKPPESCRNSVYLRVELIIHPMRTNEKVSEAARGPSMLDHRCWMLRRPLHMILDGVVHVSAAL